MKTSNHFKNTIKTYLDQCAETDVLFSFQYSQAQKNLDDCCTYILNQVKQSGCHGFADDEIFGMAIHYYNTPDVEIGSPIKCNVIVNRTIELTKEEKEKARLDAIEKAQREVYNKIKQPKRVSLKPTQSTNQLSLF